MIIPYINYCITVFLFPSRKMRSLKMIAGPQGMNRHSHTRAFLIIPMRCVLYLLRDFFFFLSRQIYKLWFYFFPKGRDVCAEGRVVKKKTILPFSSGGRDKTEKQNGVQKDKRDSGHDGDDQKLLTSQSQCKNLDLWINSSNFFLSFFSIVNTVGTDIIVTYLDCLIKSFKNYNIQMK